MLAGVENAMGTYWRPLDEGVADLNDPELRGALQRFIGAQQLRGMYLRKMYEQTIELRDKLGLMKADYEPEDDLDARDAGKFFSQKIAKDLQRMTAIYAQKPWMMIRVETEAFVTSDLPLIHLRPNGLRGGPGTPDTIAALPLGPRSLLVMGDGFPAGANQSRAGTPAFARMVNIELWNRCQSELLTGRNPTDVAD